MPIWSPSVESYELSPGIFKGRQDNALKVDEREGGAGAAAQARTIFPYPKAICSVTSGQGCEWEEKHVLQSR